MKKCKVCKAEFKPFSTLSKVCSPGCAIKLVNHTKEKEKRADTRRRKEALKTKSDWAKEVQAAVNKYVRTRDKGKPCISCGKPDDGTHQRHASHYRSVGACSALRFNTKNIYTSCQQCNTTLSGNIIEYRINLVKAYGEEFVNWLESQNQIVRYEIEYLKRLKKVFNRRANQLEKRLTHIETRTKTGKGKKKYDEVRMISND